MGTKKLLEDMRQGKKLENTMDNLEKLLDFILDKNNDILKFRSIILFLNVNRIKLKY